jgi:Spy/CpxP family protein refolding chaperone
LKTRSREPKASHQQENPAAMTLARIPFPVLFLAAALCAQVGPGVGRGPGGNHRQGPPAPPIGELAEFLALSQPQLEAIARIRQDYRAAVRDNLQAIAEKRRQANETLAGDSPDAIRIGQLLVQAKQMEESVRSREGDFVQQTQAVLDESQRAKLSSLERMVPFQSEIRQAQGLGLLAGEDGEFHFHAGGPHGPEGPPFGGAGFGLR